MSCAAENSCSWTTRRCGPLWPVGNTCLSRLNLLSQPCLLTGKRWIFDYYRPVIAALPEVWTNAFQVANNTAYAVVTWQGFFDVPDPSMPWALQPKAAGSRLTAPAAAEVIIEGGLYSAGTVVTLLSPGGNTSTTVLQTQGADFTTAVPLFRGVCVMMWTLK